MDLMNELGITKDELQLRVVEKLCDRLLVANKMDEEGEKYLCPSSLKNELKEEIEKRIEEAIRILGEKHVLPGVTAMLESLCLQETNRWGEQTGKQMTFIEYLIQRAEAYMIEKVDYDGKTQVESGRYNWTGTQTRVTHLVHKHLHYAIEQAMKEALKNANASICKGIAEAVKDKLAEVQAQLKVSVQTK